MHEAINTRLHCGNSYQKLQCHILSFLEHKLISQNSVLFLQSTNFNLAVNKLNSEVIVYETNK
jgi:hypothetical protein